MHPFDKLEGLPGSGSFASLARMLAHRAISLTAVLLAAACTTEDVDPGSRRGSAGPSGPQPYPYESTWVPRENPELGPSSGPYAWRNVVVLGGGFVTGIEFSRAEADLIYARTDVGGAYRWDAAADRWIPITDWVGRNDANLMGIESIAPDPVNPDRVYVAAGTYITSGDGKILSSDDRGASWTVNAIAAPMGGNANGRSMGERLAVDPNLPSTLYFASRTTGLWKSSDSAATWTRVSSFPAAGEPDLGLSFVFFDEQSGTQEGSSTFYVGVATTGGPSLYRTSDFGASFEPVEGQPAGLMPHHAAMDENGVLYLTFNNGPGPNEITAGGVFKYDSESATWSDVTPRAIEAGYGGVSLDPARPGTLIATTIDLWSPDLIFRSSDGGESWTELGASAGRDLLGAEYLRWHRAEPTATGWMGDIEIDPFASNRALYITGQGIWWSDDLDAADGGAPTHWTFRNQGLEETVPLALVSPPSGAHLLSGLGDIAGFRHDDLDAPPPTGMFEDPIFGNTTSLDFAEAAAEVVARVGTTGSSGGRGAYSLDGGRSWQAFRTEPAGQPASNGGQGTIAVAADGSAFVWAPRRAPPAYTTDRGVSWTACAGLPGSLRVVAADRVNPLKFYGLSSTMGNVQIFVSSDGGATFGASPGVPPAGAFTLRPVPGREGDVWLVAPDGLYRSTDSAANFARVPGSTSAYAVGFGMAAEGSDYPAIYLLGGAGEESGVLRSDDAGETWQRIDDDAHQFGWLSHVTGDPRIYGRVYLGTGGRGIIYGDLR